MDDIKRQLSSLGKGVVQANLRLNRLLERGESPSGGGAPELELLLDLLQASGQTLDAANLPAPPLPWWQRALGIEPTPGVDLEGLRLSRDGALERLDALGVRPVAEEGPADPLLHKVIEVRTTQDPALDGHIAATHRQGWARKGEVLRYAEVSAWRLEPQA